MFVTKLARALHKTEGELLDNITSSEITRWQQYYAIEPWPWDLLNFATAKQTYILANVQGGKVSFRECLVKFEPPRSATANDWDLWAKRHNAGMSKQ